MGNTCCSNNHLNKDSTLKTYSCCDNYASIRQQTADRENLSDATKGLDTDPEPIYHGVHNSLTIATGITEPKIARQPLKKSKKKPLPTLNIEKIDETYGLDNTIFINPPLECVINGENAKSPRQSLKTDEESNVDGDDPDRHMYNEVTFESRHAKNPIYSPMMMKKEGEQEPGDDGFSALPMVGEDHQIRNLNRAISTSRLQLNLNRNVEVTDKEEPKTPSDATLGSDLYRGSRFSSIHEQLDSRRNSGTIPNPGVIPRSRSQSQSQLKAIEVSREESSSQKQPKVSPRKNETADTIISSNTSSQSQAHHPNNQPLNRSNLYKPLEPILEGMGHETAMMQSNQAESDVIQEMTDEMSKKELHTSPRGTEGHKQEVNLKKNSNNESSFQRLPEDENPQSARKDDKLASNLMDPNTFDAEEQKNNVNLSSNKKYFKEASPSSFHPDKVDADAIKSSKSGNSSALDNGSMAEFRDTSNKHQNDPIVYHSRVSSAKEVTSLNMLKESLPLNNGESLQQRSLNVLNDKGESRGSARLAYSLQLEGRYGNEKRGNYSTPDFSQGLLRFHQHLPYNPFSESNQSQRPSQRPSSGTRRYNHPNPINEADSYDEKSKISKSQLTMISGGAVDESVGYNFNIAGLQSNIHSNYTSNKGIHASLTENPSKLGYNQTSLQVDKEGEDTQQNKNQKGFWDELHNKVQSIGLHRAEGESAAFKPKERFHNPFDERSKEVDKNNNEKTTSHNLVPEDQNESHPRTMSPVISQGCNDISALHKDKEFPSTDRLLSTRDFSNQDFLVSTQRRDLSTEQTQRAIDMPAMKDILSERTLEAPIQDESTSNTFQDKSGENKSKVLSKKALQRITEVESYIITRTESMIENVLKRSVSSLNCEEELSDDAIINRRESRRGVSFSSNRLSKGNSKSHSLSNSRNARSQELF